MSEVRALHRVHDECVVHRNHTPCRQTGRVRTADEREAAEMLRRLLDAVDRGELTALTPAERRNLRRLEGMLAALEATQANKRRSKQTVRSEEDRSI